MEWRIGCLLVVFVWQSIAGYQKMMSVHFGIKGVYCNAPTNL